jgi:PAT family beta-lactamase induction signal transducer AmpG
MRKYFEILFNRRMLVVFIMGFSSGLPLALTGGTLKARLTDAGLDLKTIGFFSLVGLPYVWKLLWSPFFDRYAPLIGRRRGWLFITQTFLIFALCAMALINPATEIALVAIAAVAIAFFSASQDIVIDAYRREILDDVELAWGNSLAVNGYRVAMLVSGGLALILADRINWTNTYLLMAAFVGLGLVTTFFAQEPQVEGARPKSLVDAYAAPLKDLFTRRGALWMLGFVFLYKLGDAMALENTMYFYKKVLLFSNEEVGTIVKLFGFWGVIAGGLIGPLIIIRIGLFKSLFIFGVFQILCILGFAWLASVDKSTTALAAVILAENLTVGMSTSAYVTYIATQTNKHFTATQYALLSSITGLPRVVFGSTTGWLADKLGWQTFFILCAAIAVPALLMIPYLHRLSILNKDHGVTTPEAVR